MTTHLGVPGPPYPWELRPGDPIPPGYGAPGDQWLSDEATVAFLHEPWKTLSALWRLGFLLADGSWSWIVPSSPLVYREAPVKWLRSVIHAKLGTLEEMCHVLNWTGDAGPLGTVSDADLLTFATVVRDKWQTAFLGNMGTYLGADTHYDEVRVAQYEQTAANTHTGAAHENRGKCVQTSGTLIAPITDPQVHSGASLPYQVAAVITMRTSLPQSGGPSHGRSNRGRTYLGGLAQSLINTHGQIDVNAASAIAGNFGNFCDQVSTATTYRLSIVSLSRLDWNPVTAWSIGTVPDTQRRRRASLVENRYTAWPQG